MGGRADRWEAIARAVIEQPARSLKDIAADFKVSRSTLYRACDKHLVQRDRRYRRWGLMTIAPDAWLHVGDIVMSYRDGHRQAEIIEVAYHEDLTVSYRCRPVSPFRKGRARWIHEHTLKNGYVRIKTTERKLPDERFLQWTFGRSN